MNFCMILRGGKALTIILTEKVYPYGEKEYRIEYFSCLLERKKIKRLNLCNDTEVLGRKKLNSLTFRNSGWNLCTAVIILLMVVLRNGGPPYKEKYQRDRWRTYVFLCKIIALRLIHINPS